MIAAGFVVRITGADRDWLDARGVSLVLDDLGDDLEELRVEDPMRAEWLEVVALLSTMADAWPGSVVRSEIDGAEVLELTADGAARLPHTYDREETP